MEMELNTILDLVKAGFTKDEIMQMAQPTPPEPFKEPVQMEMELPAPPSEPSTAQVIEPVNVPVPQPVPQPVPEKTQDQPSMADIMQSIAKLTSAVQANAIAQSVLPQGMPHQPTAEDMLAEIIRPSYHERS